MRNDKQLPFSTHHGYRNFNRAFLYRSAYFFHSHAVSHGLIIDGAQMFITTGLDMPSAMTFGPDGVLYVSNREHGIQGTPSQREIVKINLNQTILRY